MTLLGHGCINWLSFVFEKPQCTMVCHVSKVPVRCEELSIMLDGHCRYETVHGRNGYAFAPARIRYPGSFDIGLFCCENEWKACQGFFQSFKLSFSPNPERTSWRTIPARAIFSSASINSRRTRASVGSSESDLRLRKARDQTEVSTRITASSVPLCS